MCSSDLFPSHDNSGQTAVRVPQSCWSYYLPAHQSFRASGQALQTGASHGDCVRAAMFWAKTRMGWKETNVQEHTGANDKPLIPSAKEMTTDELKAELEALGVKL